MQATMIFALLPVIAMAVNPDRHVREVRAHGGQHVKIAVQPNGAVLKVSEGSDFEPASTNPQETEDEQKEPIKKPQESQDEITEINDNIAKARKKFDDGKGKKSDMPSGDDSLGPADVDPKPQEEQIEALAKKTKVQVHDAHRGSQSHVEAAPKSQAKAHHAAKAQPREGLSLAVEPAQPPVALAAADPAADENQDQTQNQTDEKSWKSAFFFFASLVLIAVLAIVVVSIFYFNRDQSKAGDAPETVGLKGASAKASGSQYINDSSSTSDSGEKIAMLFDRVRQSLEDLSDKTAAQQADVAGGQSQEQGGKI